MKKLICFVILCLLMFPSRIFALGPACVVTDGCPMFDFVDEAGAIMKSVGSLANNVQKVIKQTTDSINNARVFVEGMAQGEMPSSGISNNNPGQRTMQNCLFRGTEYDNKNADDVADLVTMLFLERTRNQNEADKQLFYREKFYHDSIMEIKSAIEALEEDLQSITGEKIEKAIKLLESGEGSGSGSDGNKNAIDTEGDAGNAIADLYDVLLKVSALRAQFIAVKAIHNAKPLEQPEDEEILDKQVFLNVPKFYISSEIKNSEILAFARAEVTSDNVVDSLSALEVSAKISDGSLSYLDDLVFTVAPDSPNAHGYIKSEEKMEQLHAIAPLVEDVNRAREIHNLINRLESYEALAKSMEEMRERHKKSIEKVELADKCVRSYIGRHFSDVNKVWGNNGKNITDYDSRKGISGWAWQAYEAAKAAETVETSTDDIKVLDVEVSQDEIITDKTDMDANEDMLKSKTSNISNKSQEAKREEEARRSNMLSWQIGSEASKMLASAPDQWGKRVNYPAFSIWKDVKFFYSNYIDKKYNNIINYLNKFSKFDVVRVVADVLEKGADPANIDLSDINALNDTLSQELKDETDKYNANVAYARAQNNPSVKSLLAKKQSLLKEIEINSNQLKIELEELSDMRNQVHASAGDEMRAAVTYIEPYPADINAASVGKGTIIEVKNASDNMEDFMSKSSTNKEKLGIKAQEKKVQDSEKKQAYLKKELSDLEEKINSLILDSQDGGEDIMLQLATKKIGLKDMVANMLSKHQNDDANIKDRINALITKELEKRKNDANAIVEAGNAYQNLVRNANSELSSAISQMTILVNNAKLQILALGDDLYDPANHQKIVDIHRNMIDSVKAISITVDGGFLPPVRGIMLFASLLGADTSVEEEDFFVGSPAKKRDIKAPKVVFKDGVPPLREVFHFDLTDFMNVKPFSKRGKRSSKINVQDFLNSGAEIPTVWKYLLRNPVFVEDDLDLAELFSLGCQDTTFYRHGTMPCKVKGSSMIADVNVEVNDTLKTVNVKYSIRPESAYAGKKFSECTTLYAKGKDVYSTYRGIDVSKELFPSDISPDCDGSELGTLLTMDKKGNILFRESVYDAFYEIWDEKEKGKELSKTKKRKMTAIDPTPFNRNQIGEFLKYAESEQKIRQQLKELEKEYNESKEELFGLLRQFGFEPSPDLNMAKSEDSLLVRTKLRQIKNQNIALANEKIQEIDIVDNPVVEERIKEQQSIINAMHLDKDEAIIIGEGSDDHNDFEEKIKSAKANKNVVLSYKNKIKNTQDDIADSDFPYCSIY